MTGLPARMAAIFRRGDLIAVILVAIILRLIIFAASNNQGGIDRVIENCFDCRLYSTAARMIASGISPPENALFYYGPGYLYFLAFNIILFGSNPILLIVANIFISSLSCLLVYVLGMILTRSYPVSITAAILAGFSYTSITLSCVTLSDTFYFFIFLLALILYLKALDSQKLYLFILSGLLFGYAILTRSAGQFWPIIMVLIAAAHILICRRNNKKPRHHAVLLMGKALVAVAIAVILMGIWIARNYSVHDVPALAITGANGPANVAAITIERLTGRYSKETMREWIADSLFATGRFGDIYKTYSARASEVVDSLGWQVAKTYLLLLWENLNDINYFHRILIPEYNDVMIPAEKFMKSSRLNYASFILSIAGILILLWKRRLWAAMVLGGVYTYYIMMLGAFRWQGARYAFPSQIASDILIAIVIVSLLQCLVRLLWPVKIIPKEKSQ